ncbi:hypothetical protein ACUNGZ_20555, partial [Serratia sp. IR-2025]
CSFLRRGGWLRGGAFWAGGAGGLPPPPRGGRRGGPPPPPQGFFGEVNLWLDERMTERTARSGKTARAKT